MVYHETIYSFVYCYFAFDAIVDKIQSHVICIFLKTQKNDLHSFCTDVMIFDN